MSIPPQNMRDKISIAKRNFPVQKFPAKWNILHEGKKSSQSLRKS